MIGVFQFVVYLILTIKLGLANPLDYYYDDDEEDINEFEDSKIVQDIPEECNRGHYSISKPTDLSAIEDCKIVHGNVTIVNYENPIVSFGNIETITGNLMVSKSPDIVRMEGDSLTNIGNKMILRELTSLSVIVFPSLTSIKVIDWRVLPILSSVQFSNEIGELQSITISDTSLTGFSGFLTEKLELFDINNNRFLEKIDSNVEIIGESLHISANAYGLAVSLPKLKSANNMTIQDVEELNMNSLETVSNSVSLINNQFESLKLPNLKSIGGTLNIFKNKKLTSVNFNNISEIGGGLIISNNTMIEKINFLPKLAVIGGALELAGNIKELSLKQLKLVKGSTKLKTESPSFDCSQFLRSDLISVIRGGKIECSNANNEKFITNTPEGNDTNSGVIYDGNGNFVQYPNAEDTIFESGAQQLFYSVLVIVMIISSYMI